MKIQTIIKEIGVLPEFLKGKPDSPDGEYVRSTLVSAISSEYSVMENYTQF